MYLLWEMILTHWNHPNDQDALASPVLGDSMGLGFKFCPWVKPWSSGVKMREIWGSKLQDLSQTNIAEDWKESEERQMDSFQCLTDGGKYKKEWWVSGLNYGCGKTLHWGAPVPTFSHPTSVLLFVNLDRRCLRSHTNLCLRIPSLGRCQTMPSSPFKIWFHAPLCHDSSPDWHHLALVCHSQTS